MRLLLDTHTLLWWWLDDARLSASAATVIRDASNEVFVSVVSAWEIATKHRLGKLLTPPDVIRRFPELMAADGFKPLLLNLQHALQAGSYAQAHRDPFDRMLAAQSELDSLTLVTADPALRGFPCRVHW